MKLLYFFAAILAISLAETEKKEIEDSEAAASNIEVLKEGADLKAEASAYNSYVPPSQRPPLWTVPPYVPPTNTWNPPKEPVNNWNLPVAPTNTWNPPQGHVDVVPSKKPDTWVPPVQSDYVPQYPHPPATWTTPHYPPSTTTPVSVIKNEQYFYDNGAYKYEYQIADGTHVGEEGYFTDPKHDEDSLVKRGWYSYIGADGKTYTVTYWADKTGYHAYGDHLPTPPPSAAVYPTFDKEKEKPHYDYTTQAPHVTYYPTKPSYVPTYYPTQPTYYPQNQQNYPTYGKK